MKKSVGLVFSMFLLLMVLLSGCTSAPVATEVPAPAATNTPLPMPPTLVPEPTATATLIPSPTLEPTVVPTVIQLPQQWNGSYTYLTSGRTQNVILLIEEMNGTTFTGKMIWMPFGNSRGATLKMNGEFITDFGNGGEQVRWNNLEDYKNGDTSGTWLKWTETEIIVGRNYTTNGWYYAHIREDGTMVAVYFFNSTETIADNGKFIFKQKTP